jgi:hypothetical protein
MTFTNQGPWNDVSAYSPGDVVQYNGSAYCCYESVASPPAWNTADESGMTLSSKNTTDDTATSGSGACYVNSNSNGQTTGKWYFEFEATELTNNNTTVGIATAGFAENFGGSALGNIGGTFSGSGTGSFSRLVDLNRRGIAVDLTNKLFWITPDVTTSPINWNGSTSNDPGTGTGGVSLGTLPSGNLFENFYSPSGANQGCTLFTTAGSFEIPSIPSGFSAWQAGNPSTSPDQDDEHWIGQGAISSADSNFAVTATGELELASLPGGEVIGNSGASAAEPGPATLTALIDRAFGSAEGSLLQRGPTGWQVLAPGTAGNVLQSGGASALNSWLSLNHGTWTATDGSGAGLTLTTTFGEYWQIGDLVILSAQLSWPNNSDNHNVLVQGMPTIGANGFGFFNTFAFTSTYPCNASSRLGGLIFVDGATGTSVTNAQLSGAAIGLTVIYQG